MNNNILYCDKCATANVVLNRDTTNDYYICTMCREYEESMSNDEPANDSFDSSEVLDYNS